MCVNNFFYSDNLENVYFTFVKIYLETYFVSQNGLFIYLMITGQCDVNKNKLHTEDFSNNYISLSNHIVVWCL